jgi:hypothetical protein
VPTLPPTCSGKRLRRRRRKIRWNASAVAEEQLAARSTCVPPDARTLACRSQTRRRSNCLRSPSVQLLLLLLSSAHLRPPRRLSGGNARAAFG